MGRIIGRVKEIISSIRRMKRERCTKSQIPVVIFYPFLKLWLKFVFACTNYELNRPLEEVEEEEEDAIYMSLVRQTTDYFELTEPEDDVAIDTETLREKYNNAGILTQ
jgi:hypothetical protein